MFKIRPGAGPGDARYSPPPGLSAAYPIRSIRMTSHATAPVRSWLRRRATLILVAAATTTIAVTGVFLANPAQAAVPWDSVAAGYDFTCGIKTDHTLWCWGDNHVGQLGRGTTVPSSTPLQVGDGTSWKSVDVSFRSACALTIDGTRNCWGLNANVELGLGDTVDRNVPTPLPNDTVKYLQLSLGYASCAVSVDNALYCWGLNGHGAMGIPHSAGSSRPLRIGIRSDWASVQASGGHFACALTIAGERNCWGNNGSHQQGFVDTI